jgi:hypothetical protein
MPRYDWGCFVSDHLFEVEGKGYEEESSASWKLWDKDR